MGIFPTVDDAMNAVFKSLAGGASPVAMEFLDALVIKALKDKLNVDLPDWAGAILIGDVDGSLEDELTYQLDILDRSFKENGAKEFAGKNCCI